MTVTSGRQGDFGGHSDAGPSALDFSALDFSTLTAPVSRAEVRRYRAAAKGRPWSASPPMLVTVLTVILFGIAGLVVLSITVSFLRVGFHDGVATPAFFAPLAGLAIIVVVLVVFARAASPRFGKWSRWTRLDRFARANGLTFLPTGVPTYPGSIFDIGGARQARDHLMTASGRYVDLGNYTYTTGSAATLDMTDPQTLRRLFRIVDTVGAKTLRQTARYSDERAAGGTVAPAGQRMRHAVPVAFIVVAVVAAIIVISNGNQLLSMLFG